MATATEVLAQSQIEGASLVLIYDDVTLIGNRFEANVGNTAVGPMTVSIALNNGFAGTTVIQPNRFNQAINIPANRRPQGVLVTTRFGTQTIDWGIQSISISFSSS
jgi:hypothetical protein